MKICVTSQGDVLESNVDPRFGRANYFVFIDPDNMEFEAIENPNAGAMGGAGIQSAQLIAGKGVDTVLTGNIGPNAFQALQAAGIKIITDISGTVKSAVELFKKGKIKPVQGATVSNHYGISPAGKIGGGAGGGIGRGGAGGGSANRGRRGQGRGQKGGG